MKEVISEIRRWRADGQRIALATVVETWGSAPRKVGAKMALTGDGRLAGSVSGGCVEGAVAEVAHEILQGGRPCLLTFGVADESAWEVGLACGGTIQIFVEGLDELVFPEVDHLLAAEQAGAVATVIAGPDPVLGRKLLTDGEGNTAGRIHKDVDTETEAALGEAIRLGASRRFRLDAQGIELFLDVLLPPPTLIMIGGAHIALHLAAIAKAMGYRTLVIDPRQAFASAERFPHVDRLIPHWPQDALPDIRLNENTAVALLTHDPKIDDPALELVLASPVFYVGALGSRRTHADRVARLREAGLTAGQIERIHAPIGLDLGAQSPDEIALSIMAEIVAVRRGVRGESGAG